MNIVITMPKVKQTWKVEAVLAKVRTLFSQGECVRIYNKKKNNDSTSFLKQKWKYSTEMWSKYRDNSVSQYVAVQI